MIKIIGHIKAVDSSRIVADIPLATIGDVCTVRTREGRTLAALVVAFDESGVTLAPLGDTRGLTPGLPVENSQQTLSFKASKGLLGQTLTPFGYPLGREVTHCEEWRQVPINGEAPSYEERLQISECLSTGIRAVDLFCPLAKGQRIGLFAPPGVGKTSFMKEVIAHSSADVIILALVGERGREVEEFIRFLDGSELGKRTVTVAATSNSSPMERRLAPYTATALAEYFRDEGLDVLLLVDSLTRAIRAMREIGLASGELPIQEGLTPSIYAEVPRLLERAGQTKTGSISAIYSVLTPADGEHDPLAEELKSLLDGHVVLSRELAMRGIRPAVDVQRSLSRLANDISTSQIIEDRTFLLSLLARAAKDKDLVLLGGVPDPELRVALALEDEILGLIKQPTEAQELKGCSLTLLSALAKEGRMRLMQTKRKDREEVVPTAQLHLPN